MRTWQISIALPDHITQEQLTTELQQVCEAGFDLTAEQYNVTVQPQAEPEAAAA